MRQRKTVLMWVLAAALLAALPVTQALADPPSFPADKVKTKPVNIPPVPRGIPDLIPYWNYDPPKHPLFDISKLTISGDMRVRGEYRNNNNFGTNLTNGGRASNTADQFIQQWMRLGINYAVSQDVDTFLQFQYGKNWGSNGGTAAAPTANDPASINSVGIRQAYMLIRNLGGVQGLSMKAGRQLLVMGNHRLFGHFDWNNVGFSHDGITFQYNQPQFEVWSGWLRAGDVEANAAGFAAGGGSDAGGVGGGGRGNANTDILFTRLAFKPMAGLAIEPLWVYLNNKQSSGATATNAAHAPGQNRHTLGGRVAYKQGMFDATGEYYWQTGSMGIAGSPQRLHINANAFALVAGVTLKDVAMKPRFGLEFNYASGDGDGQCTNANPAACNGNANTFENLYPTNHILMGYADRMAWRNMVGYSADVQLKPTAASHFEMKFWIFRKANNGDCWYGANQACFSTANAAGGIATSNSLYKEIDGVYTLFFAGNKVAWQTGVSYLIAGRMVDQLAAGNAAANGADPVNSIWGYSQLHVNF